MMVVDVSSVVATIGQTAVAGAAIGVAYLAMRYGLRLYRWIRGVDGDSYVSVDVYSCPNCGGIYDESQLYLGADNPDVVSCPDCGFTEDFAQFVYLGNSDEASDDPSSEVVDLSGTAGAPDFAEDMSDFEATRFCYTCGDFAPFDEDSACMHCGVRGDGA